MKFIYLQLNKQTNKKTFVSNVMLLIQHLKQLAVRSGESHQLPDGFHLLTATTVAGSKNYSCLVIVAYVFMTSEQVGIKSGLSQPEI